MANFLDLTTGMPALWAKIKSKFYTKAEVDALIPEDEVMVVNITYDDTTDTYSADKTVAEILAHINNGGTVNAQTGVYVYNLLDYDANAVTFSSVAIQSLYDNVSVMGNKIEMNNYSGDDEVTYLDYVYSNIPKASGSSDGLPAMDGTASRGDSLNYARANHVHPSDTSRAAVADVLTKTNITSYTPTANYHPATKKYVDDAVAAIPDEVMWINLAYNSTNKTYSVDKTFAQMIAHINNGGTIVATGQFSESYHLSLVNKSSELGELRFSRTFADEDYSTSPTDHYKNAVVTQTISITKNDVVTWTETIVSNSCATADEIEEMCDALGFYSVTIDTSDYEERSNSV